jgi:hypothetical protein
MQIFAPYALEAHLGMAKALTSAGQRMRDRCMAVLIAAREERERRTV